MVVGFEVLAVALIEGHDCLGGAARPLSFGVRGLLGSKPWFTVLMAAEGHDCLGGAV